MYYWSEYLNKFIIINYLLCKCWIWSFNNWRSGVLLWFFLGIICMICPGLWSVWAIFIIMLFIIIITLWCTRPGRIFLVTWTVTDALETRCVAHWWCWWWWRRVPFIESKTETIESNTFTVSKNKKKIYRNWTIYRLN